MFFDPFQFHVTQRTCFQLFKADNCYKCGLHANISDILYFMQKGQNRLQVNSQLVVVLNHSVMEYKSDDIY